MKYSWYIGARMDLDVSRSSYVAAPEILGKQGLLEQHEIGKLPDAAGHRGDRAGNLGYGIEGDVAGDVAVLAHIDAHVNHRGARLDHIGGDEAGFASGGHEHIRLTGPRGEIAGVDMADGDGGVAMQQEEGERLADDVARADNDGALASERNVRAVENLQHGGAGGGDEAGQLKEEVAGAAQADAVHVFARVNGFGDGALREVGREGKLHEDALHAVVGVQ